MGSKFCKLDSTMVNLLVNNKKDKFSPLNSLNKTVLLCKTLSMGMHRLACDIFALKTLPE